MPPVVAIANSFRPRKHKIPPRISNGTELAARWRKDAWRNGDQSTPGSPPRCRGTIPYWESCPPEIVLLTRKTSQQMPVKIRIGLSRLTIDALYPVAFTQPF